MSQQMSMIIGIASGVFGIYSTSADLEVERTRVEPYGEMVSGKHFWVDYWRHRRSRAGNTPRSTCIFTTRTRSSGTSTSTGSTELCSPALECTGILPEISNKQWYSKALGEIHLGAAWWVVFRLGVCFHRDGVSGCTEEAVLPVNHRDDRSLSLWIIRRGSSSRSFSRYGGFRPDSVYLEFAKDTDGP